MCPGGVHRLPFLTDDNLRQQRNILNTKTAEHRRALERNGFISDVHVILHRGNWLRKRR
jgi:hypothetical protein